jgi:ferritin-like metal-binding protein YciE
LKSAASKATAARGSAASRNTSSRASKGGRAGGDPRNDLEKILQDLMKDIYYAEKKLVKALGKMAKSATNPKLKEAFTTHQSQTEDQIAKLEKAFSILGQQPKAKKCAAMDGLVEESNEHIEEYSKGAGLDAALIVGAQKVEHYEIASYGSMRSFARTLGYEDAARIFEEIREQESDTDELLTTLAESVVNPRAEEETEDVSQSAKSGSGGRGSEDSEAGEDSSSRSSGRNGNGREGGDDTMALSGEEMGSISGMTDGNNREGASETGPAMGY